MEHLSIFHLRVTAQQRAGDRSRTCNAFAAWSEHAVFSVSPPRRFFRDALRASPRWAQHTRAHTARDAWDDPDIQTSVGARGSQINHRPDRTRTCVVSVPNGVPEPLGYRPISLRTGSNRLGLPHEG